MKKKIIIVDMVNGFVKEGTLHDEKIMGIVDNIKKLIDKKRDYDLIVLEDSHENNCAEFASFPVHCLKGSSESKTIDELQYVFSLPNFEACIQKNSTNGFFALEKANLVDGDEYIIVGCCTDICVAQLALTLKIYGNDSDATKKVIVVKDAVSTYDNDYHNAEEYSDAAFKLMSVAGIEINNLKEIIGE